MKKKYNFQQFSNLKPGRILWFFDIILFVRFVLLSFLKQPLVELALQRLIFSLQKRKFKFCFIELIISKIHFINIGDWFQLLTDNMLKLFVQWIEALYGGAHTMNIMLISSKINHNLTKKCSNVWPIKWHKLEAVVFSSVCAKVPQWNFVEVEKLKINWKFLNCVTFQMRMYGTLLGQTHKNFKWRTKMI